MCQARPPDDCFRAKSQARLAVLVMVWSRPNTEDGPRKSAQLTAVQPPSTAQLRRAGLPVCRCTRTNPLPRNFRPVPPGSELAWLHLVYLDQPGTFLTNVKCYTTSPPRLQLCMGMTVHPPSDANEEEANLTMPWTCLRTAWRRLLPAAFPEPASNVLPDVSRPLLFYRSIDRPEKLQQLLCEPN
jgi:hypothetical protein